MNFLYFIQFPFISEVAANKSYVHDKYNYKNTNKNTLANRQTENKENKKIY